MPTGPNLGEHELPERPEQPVGSAAGNGKVGQAKASAKPAFNTVKAQDARQIPHHAGLPPNARLQHAIVTFRHDVERAVFAGEAFFGEHRLR
jgi:hypothetical protein